MNNENSSIEYIHDSRQNQYGRLLSRYFADKEKTVKPKKIAYKISRSYIIISILWILLSDKIVEYTTRDKEMITLISMTKGWLFVILTGIMIYYLIYSSLKRIQAAETELIKSYQELSATHEELEAAYEEIMASEDELRNQYDRLEESRRKLIKSEENLQYLAYHDSLTGLRNRLSLNKHLSAFIQEESEKKGVLFFIDSDNFKLINDSLGHSLGDQLLIEIGKRIHSFCKKDSHVYRLGGDEFVVFVEMIESEQQIREIAQHIIRTLKEPFYIQGSLIHMTVSIGISIYPNHGSSVDQLLKNADIAMFKAKEQGRNRFVFYSDMMNQVLVERMEIEKYLHTALENNEFTLFYQPQIDIILGKISGFEALLRWNNPNLGFVSPQKFIQIAEDTHLIKPIGEWVLKTACSFLKNIHSQGYHDYTISVNISVLQLIQEDFVDTVMQILESTELAPHFLELEITESVLVESFDTMVAKLQILKEKGIHIALDDFGKGYSSLSYLKQLPITSLKIDKCFIDDIAFESKSSKLIGAIVAMGRDMELCVIAEGVETEQQLAFLKEYQCNEIQGYLFSKPLPENQVIQLIKDNHLNT